MRPYQTLLLALWGLTAPASEAELSFGPVDGLSLELELTAERKLEGGELTVMMSGSEVPSAFLPELNLEETDLKHLLFRETYAGQGSALLRRYEELDWTNVGQMEMSGPEGSQSFPWEAEGTSSLQGRVLHVEADEDGALQATAMDNDEVDIPDGLQADLSLRQLLPAAEVAVDETWTVEGDALAVLFSPGGDFAWELPAEAAMRMLPEIRERAHEGELQVTLKSIEDGIATCSISGELDRITEQPGDLSQVPVADGTATDTVQETWTVEGQLLWNTQGNHITELSLVGEWRSETDTERDPEQEGPEYSSVFSVDGSYSFELRAEEVEDAVIEASSGK